MGGRLDAAAEAENEINDRLFGLSAIVREWGNAA